MPVNAAYRRTVIWGLLANLASRHRRHRVRFAHLPMQDETSRGES